MTTEFHETAWNPESAEGPPGLNAWSAMDHAGQCEFPSTDPDVPEIWLYSDRMSYFPGDEVVFYVHTSVPAYSIVFERDGASLDKVHEMNGLIGTRQKTPEDAYKNGCDWQESFRYRIPADWKSGVYIVSASCEDAEKGKTTTEHFFVVKARNPGVHSSIVLMLATSTYIAYNDWGGANSYRTRNTDLPQAVLSAQRPWARGFVRLPLSAPRFGQGPKLKPFETPRFPEFEWALTQGYSRHYSHAGWAYYERHFAQWAEHKGFALEYITQHDLHYNPELLDSYKLLVVVGHDEYWTWEMRDALDSFLEKGGNFSRFAGNFLWQVRLEDDGNKQVCYKLADDDPLLNSDQSHLVTTMWDHPVVNRSAAASIGLSAAGGCYATQGGATPRGTGGFTVYREDHWAFELTDLYYGDVFGERPTMIVAFEVDGLDFCFKNGLPVPTYLDGAPDNTQILAMAPAIKGEQDHTMGKRLINAPMGEFGMFTDDFDSYDRFLDKDKFRYAKGQGSRSKYGCAAIATCSRGKGTVFNAGATCWIHGLRDRDFFTEQITCNVLNRLAG